jgi:hypothetical protein
LIDLFLSLELPEEQLVLGGAGILRVRGQHELTAHVLGGQFVVLDLSGQEGGIVVTFGPHGDARL